MPLDEQERLRALERLDVLDSAPEREFDSLVATAALVCGVPISLVSLIDHDRQWFKANVGLPGVTETPRDVAFCAHAILDDGTFEVPDALADPRFADNPLVATAPYIRFYAGATLRLSDGAHVGTLCVIDRVPRRLSEKQREALRLLSIAAVQALESRRMARAFRGQRNPLSHPQRSVPARRVRHQCEPAHAPTPTRAGEAIFGLSEAEALDEGWSRTLHPDDKAAVFNEWQHAAATLKQDFDMEFRVRRDDGTVRHVRSVCAPGARTVKAEVTDFVGSVEDITDRLLARRALDEERVASGRDHPRHRRRHLGMERADRRNPLQCALGRDRGGHAGRTGAHHHPHLGQSWPIPKTWRVPARCCRRTFPVRDSPRTNARPECAIAMVTGCGCSTAEQVLTRTADGQPEWMFGTHMDITARKAQEEQLLKSEELLNRTGALAQVGGWELDIASGQHPLVRADLSHPWRGTRLPASAR